MIRKLTITGAILVASLAAIAEPKIEGLSGEAAARILSASGVRVLAVGAALPPGADRGSRANVAGLQPAPSPVPDAGSRPEPDSRRMAQAWGCCCEPKTIVIPPAGVAVVEREVLTFTSRRSDARRK